MSTRFSDASLLLIENWDMVKEIRESEANLATELRDYLFSLEHQLQQLPWWDGQWVFQRFQDAQIYIAHADWKQGDEYAVWIGLEQFTPESLFGTESFATLYIWVAGCASELVTPLRALVESREDLVGELSAKANRYVVKAALRKCLPEELDRFDEVYGEPALKFFDYYGQMAEEITAVLGAK